MDKLWLPEGHVWGLHVSHAPANDAGRFNGGGWKMIWHTAEMRGAEATARVVVEKDACPHICIDPFEGRVVQQIPFNRAARALKHTFKPETNRANAIQVEIADFAKNSQDWPVSAYAHLAALAVLIEHRVAIPRRNYHSFTNPRRLTGQGFVGAKGHLGHAHVPGNDHWDPGKFRITLLFNQMLQVTRQHKS